MVDIILFVDIYPCAVCARVMRLCPSVYVRTYMCVCVSSKNTPVCVLPLENLHENTLCSFFTEFIVLWRRFLCWQALLERLIHGFLKLSVLVRELYGIVGVSPNLLSMLMSSLSLTCTVRQCISLSWGLLWCANQLLVHVCYHLFFWSCLWASCNMRVAVMPE